MQESDFVAFPIAILLILLGIVGTVIWIWSIIHCVNNAKLTDTNRIIGIVLIVVLGLLGSFIYLFLPRENSLP